MVKKIELKVGYNIFSQKYKIIFPYAKSLRIILLPLHINDVIGTKSCLIEYCIYIL